MQESKMAKGYKRQNSIAMQSVGLAFVTVICCILGVEIFRWEITLENEKKEQEIYARNMEIINVVEKVKEDWKKEKEQLEIVKAKLAEETTKKVVTPSTVQYTSRGSSVDRTVEEAPTEYKEVIEVKATAYCLCKKCCGKSEDNPAYGVTRSGLKIIPGTGMKVIAVDPNIIPLGSKVYVEGVDGVPTYGYAVAADTGSAIKNYKIDLYMDSHEETVKWGIRNMKVYVIE